MSFWSIVKPQETTNLVTNPSFENNATTGWGKFGTNTIAISTAQQYSGVRSLLCTYQDSTGFAYYNITLPTASQPYMMSAWVYVPSNWNGGDIKMSAALFTSSTITDVKTWQDGVDPVDTWIRIVGRLNIVSDVTGYISIITTSVPSAGRAIYIDAVQIELPVLVGSSIKETSYCDGSLQGCKWNGVPNESTSTRNVFESSGGEILNFEDDLSLHISDESGSGMLPVRNHSSPLPLSPGSLFDGRNLEARNIVFSSHLQGNSITDFHTKKRELIEALDLDSHKVWDKPVPLTLEYTGAGDTKRINAVYDGGLERGLPSQVTDDPDIQLRFRADDPLFYAGDDGASMSTQASASIGSFVGKVGGGWTNLSVTTSGAVNTSAFWNNELYIGGSFLNWDGIGAADYIAKWDGSSWSAVGTYTGGLIRIIKSGADGLYVGSDNGFYKWDGSSWSTPGSPSSAGAVYDLAWGNDGKIYIVGAFTNWDGDSASDYVVVYDIGTGTFAPIGTTGANATMRSVVALSNGVIYLGGDATTIDSVASNRIFKYDIATDAVSAISSGFNLSVYIMVADQSGRIYCGGSFTNSDYVRIAYLENDVIFGMGDANGLVDSMSVNARGQLIVSGGFTTIGNLQSPDRVAIWNGSVWVRVDIDLPGGASLTDVLFNENDIYIGISSSGTATYAHPNTLTNNGSALTYPTLVIKNDGTGTMDLVQIKNETTGATLYFNYSLLEGEVVTLNTKPGEQTMTSNLRGNVWNALSENSDLGQFYLILGDNLVTAYQSNGSAASKYIDAYWPIAFLSQD